MEMVEIEDEADGEVGEMEEEAVAEEMEDEEAGMDEEERVEDLEGTRYCSNVTFCEDLTAILSEKNRSLKFNQR